jgi:hypothetical protein
LPRKNLKVTENPTDQGKDRPNGQTENLIKKEATGKETRKNLSDGIRNRERKIRKRRTGKFHVNRNPDEVL